METLGPQGALPDVAMRPQTDELNFDRFSASPAYRAESMALMAEALTYVQVPAGEIIYHVDIGTGTGLGPQLTSVLVGATSRKAVIFGIDPDERALQKAQENSPDTDICRFQFIKGTAQETKDLLKGLIPQEGAHMTSVLDTIHEIPPNDQEDVITAMAHILGLGGVFVMNSAFTSIAQGDEDMKWGWPVARAAHKLGGTRIRNAEGLLRRPPEDYIGMVERSGLKIVYEVRKWVILPSSALQAICFYPGFRIGAFKGYNIPKEITPLQQSEALAEEFGKYPYLRRQWLRVIAQSPEEQDLAA